MAVVPKILADGQLAATKSTIYTTPASNYAYVKFFSVFNTSASSQTVVVYVNATGTSRVIARVELAQYESARIIDKDELLALEAGDLIEAQSSSGTSVDYVISGAEQSV
jgi:hypothetical protein